MSNLNYKYATGAKKQHVYLNSVKAQVEILKNKNCDCKV